MTGLEQEESLDFREILWTARRYGWLLVLPLVISFSGALVFLKVAPPGYESSVVIAIADRPNISPALEPLVRRGQDGESQASSRAVVNSKIRSRPFLEETVRRFDLASDPKIQARAAKEARRFPGVTTQGFAVRLACKELNKRTRVIPVEGNFVRITVSEKTPDRARNLATLIADLLIEESKRTSVEHVQARGEFSQDQMAVYEERLRKSEDALQRYQESMVRRGIQSSPLNASNVEDARGFVSATEHEMDQIKSRLEAERNEWAASAGNAPLPDFRSARAAEMESRLAQLETRYVLAALKASSGGTGADLLAQALKSGASAGSDLAMLQASIAGVRQSLFSEYQSIADQQLSGLPEDARSAAAGIGLDRAVLRSLSDKRQNVLSLISDFTRGVQASPHEEMELARLKGEVDTNRELLNALRREATSSRLSEALETSQLGLRIAIMEPPLLPFRPATPNPLKVLGAAAMLAILAASGIVIGGEKMSIVVRTVEQAETELGTKIVGTLPRIEGWPRPGTYLSNQWAWISILAVLVLLGAFYLTEAIVVANRTPTAATSSTKR